MKKTDKRPFLLIGTFRNEKIKNEIQLSGRDIVAKNLTSSPRNWDNIISLLRDDGDTYSCVILSLSESVLLIAQCEQYMERFSTILDLLKSLPHLIFLYEDNLFGHFNIFNTGYYSKYLFYDVFFEHRDKFKYLKNEYYEKGSRLRSQIIEDYLFDTVLPATFLAEEKAWKSVWDRNTRYATSYLRQMRIGEIPTDDDDDFSLDDYEKLPWDVEQYVDFLRETMFFTSSERAEFEYMDGPSKMRFIQEKYDGIRENYILEEKCEIVEKIESYILSDEFATDLSPRKQFAEDEYKSFKIYLQERLINEDEAISSAIDRMGTLILQMHETGLRVHSYRYSNDIVLVIRDYIENEESGIVFRSYILKDQIYANEIEKLLSLLQEYISRIRKVDISFDQRKTDIGTVYVIRSSDKEIVQENFGNYLTEFDAFLNQCCSSDLETLRDSLEKMNIDEQNIDFFVTKFSKESKRIRLDLRQEYESKMLKLRHAMESDALDKKEELSLISDISSSIDPTASTALVPSSLSIETGPYSYTQIVFGNPNYNNNDTKLLEYIAELAGDKSSLETELKILKDGKTGKSDKVTALGKLKQFLTEHAADIGGIAFKALKAYLESLL